MAKKFLSHINPLRPQQKKIPFLQTTFQMHISVYKLLLISSPQIYSQGTTDIKSSDSFKDLLSIRQDAIA